MNSNDDRVAQYVEHLDARLRARRGRSTPEDLTEGRLVFPDEISAFCRFQPGECLALVVRVLEERESPEWIEAVGNELLEQLLNENAAAVQDEVLEQLRINRRFRQAFACGTFASVDPAVIDEWVLVFRDLGTTKAAERKSLRRQRRHQK